MSEGEGKEEERKIRRWLLALVFNFKYLGGEEKLSELGRLVFRIFNMQNMLHNALCLSDRCLRKMQTTPCDLFSTPIRDENRFLCAAFVTMTSYLGQLTMSWHKRDERRIFNDGLVCRSKGKELSS